MEQFFRELGVELKVERGNRVFPASDRSADIIDALFGELRRLKVPILQERVSALDCADGALRAVEMNGEKGLTGLSCKAVILATGGLSYPATGSTGDGHALAAAAGPHGRGAHGPPWCPWSPPTPAAGRCRGWP